jgi:hypothetical protein
MTALPVDDALAAAYARDGVVRVLSAPEAGEVAAARSTSAASAWSRAAPSSSTS